MNTRMHTEDNIPFWKEKAPFTFEEMESIEQSKSQLKRQYSKNGNKRGWKRSYIVKPYEYTLGYRKTRSHNQPDFPYLSFPGYEILKLAYATKLLLRRSAAEAAFRSPSKTEHSLTVAGNKTLKDLFNKEYLERVQYPLTQEFIYELTPMGLQFLAGRESHAKSRNNTPWYAAKMDRYIVLNELFTQLSHEYKQTYFMEWLVEPEFCSPSLGVDAVMTVWEDLFKWKARETVAYHVIQANFTQDQIKEIQKVQNEFIERLGGNESGGSDDEFAEFTGIESVAMRVAEDSAPYIAAFADHFPVKPDLYIVKPYTDMRDFNHNSTQYMLKIVDKGRYWAGIGQIQEWLELD